LPRTLEADRSRSTIPGLDADDGAGRDLRLDRQWGTSEALAPTRGLLAVPAVFNLAAGARQVIRVASREAAASDIETAYRLLITEVPTATPETAAGIRFALRLSLPVFITPPGAVAAPEWTLRQAGAAVARLEVTNTAVPRTCTSAASWCATRRPGACWSNSTSRATSWRRAHTAGPTSCPSAAGPVVVEAQTNLGGLTIDLDR
jgi:hypothetical protein